MFEESAKVNQSHDFADLCWLVEFMNGQGYIVDDVRESAEQIVYNFLGVNQMKLEAERRRMLVIQSNA